MLIFNKTLLNDLVDYSIYA